MADDKESLSSRLGDFLDGLFCVFFIANWLAERVWFLSHLLIIYIFGSNCIDSLAAGQDYYYYILLFLQIQYKNI